MRTACLLLFPIFLFGPGAAAQQADGNPRICHISNAGFWITDGKKSMLVDALLAEGLQGYAVPSDDLERAMEKGCRTFPAIKAMRFSDRDAYLSICHAIREDGVFVQAGENDALIVQKLVANPNAFGIFGFSFLDQNLDKIQGNRVNGIAPEFETISDGSYPISRSMYFYIKNAHADVIPGVADYVAEFTSEAAWGPEGYLADKGLIPLSEEERARARASASGLSPLSM